MTKKPILISILSLLLITLSAYHFQAESAERSLRFRSIEIAKDSPLTITTDLKVGDQVKLEVDQNSRGMLGFSWQKELSKLIEVEILPVDREGRDPLDFKLEDLLGEGVPIVGEGRHRTKITFLGKAKKELGAITITFKGSSAVQEQEMYTVEGLALAVASSDLSQVTRLSFDVKPDDQVAFKPLGETQAQTQLSLRDEQLVWRSEKRFEQGGTYSFFLQPKTQGKAAASFQLQIRHPKEEAAPIEEETGAQTPTKPEEPTIAEIFAKMFEENQVDSSQKYMPSAKSVSLPDNESRDLVDKIYFLPPLANIEARPRRWHCQPIPVSPKGTYWIYWLSVSPQARKVLDAYDDVFQNQKATYSLNVAGWAPNNIFAFNAMLMDISGANHNQTSALLLPFISDLKFSERIACVIVDDPSEVENLSCSEVPQRGTYYASETLSKTFTKYLCSCADNEISAIPIYLRYAVFAPSEAPTTLPNTKWKEISNSITNIKSNL